MKNLKYDQFLSIVFQMFVLSFPRFLLDVSFPEVKKENKKIVKGIRESEPLNKDDYKDDPYVHVHGIC